MIYISSINYYSNQCIFNVESVLMPSGILILHHVSHIMYHIQISCIMYHVSCIIIKYHVSYSYIMYHNHISSIMCYSDQCTFNVKAKTNVFLHIKTCTSYDTTTHKILHPIKILNILLYKYNVQYLISVRNETLKNFNHNACMSVWIQCTCMDDWIDGQLDGWMDARKTQDL